MCELEVECDLSLRRLMDRLTGESKLRLREEKISSSVSIESNAASSSDMIYETFLMFKQTYHVHLLLLLLLYQSCSTIVLIFYLYTLIHNFSIDIQAKIIINIIVQLQKYYWDKNQ